MNYMECVHELPEIIMVEVDGMAPGYLGRPTSHDFAQVVFSSTSDSETDTPAVF